MDFYFVRNLHSLLIQVPLKFPSSSLVIFTSEIKLLTSLDFHAILGSVNTAVNTEDIF